MKNVKCKISHVKDRKKKNQIFDVWEQNCLAKNKTGGKPAKNYLSMSDTCCKNLSKILQAVWLSSTVNVKRDNFRQCQNPKSTLLIYKTPPAKTECLTSKDREFLNKCSVGFGSCEGKRWQFVLKICYMSGRARPICHRVLVTNYEEMSRSSSSGMCDVILALGKTLRLTKTCVKKWAMNWEKMKQVSRCHA